MAKYIIFNADDAGARPDITEAIVDCNKNGLLTSTTVLVNHIGLEEVELLNNSKNLGLGVHTNIATGSPVSDIWKKTYGNFVFSDPVSNRKNYGEVYTQDSWEKLFGEFEIGIIVQEFEAQIERFEELFDTLPTHIDSHYNTYAVESVWQAYMVVAQKYQLPVRTPIVYKKNAQKLVDSEMEISESRVEELRDLGIMTTDDYYLDYLNLKPDYIEDIFTKMDSLPDESTVDIPMHPGKSDNEREFWRKKYVEILKDQNLADELKRANIECIHYGELSDTKNA